MVVTHQQEADMNEQIQISIDRDVYDQLQMYMVPPVNDANAVIKELLFHEGRSSRSAIALEATEQHFTFAQELERSKMGIYECGGGT
jgi:hypothetical protein